MKMREEAEVHVTNEKQEVYHGKHSQMGNGHEDGTVPGGEE